MSRSTRRPLQHKAATVARRPSPVPAVTTLLPSFTVAATRPQQQHPRHATRLLQKTNAATMAGTRVSDGDDSRPRALPLRRLDHNQSPFAHDYRTQSTLRLTRVPSPSRRRPLPSPGSTTAATQLWRVATSPRQPYAKNQSRYHGRHSPFRR